MSNSLFIHFFSKNEATCDKTSHGEMLLYFSVTLL
eukprot:jgi/Antlo1/1495/535